MKKERRFFLMALGCAACFSMYSGLARAQQADFVAINQQVGVRLEKIPVNQGGITKKLWAWTENGGFAYVAVYRVPAEAGSRYTLVLTYPADKARRRIIITGESPYADEKILLPPGRSTSFPMDLTVHPAPPGAALCVETRRINFTVDSQSNMRGLFLVCLSRELPAPLEFMLKFPAVGDPEVKAYTPMPNCSWLGKIYWGKIVDFPIFMAGPGPVKSGHINKDVLAVIKLFSGTPLQEGGDFNVPPGFQAINFRASNEVNFPNKAWKIVRLLPNNQAVDVYKYGEEKNMATGQIDKIEKPVPLKKLTLPADKCRIIISGSAGSSLHLYFELMPLPAGKG